MKRVTVLIVLAAMVLSVLAGCSPKPQTEGPKTPSVSAKDDVVIGLAVSLASLVPTSAYSREEQYVIHNVYDTLFRYENGQYVPCLAESWTISEDLKTVTLKLRQDVTFHNGEKFSSKDVVYTFSNFDNPSFTFWNNSAKYIKGVKAVDDYTVEIYGPETDVYLLTVIAGTEIINEKAVMDAGIDNKFAPCGTGPYKFVSYDKHDTIILERNDSYWGFKGKELPPIKKVTYKVFADEQTEAMALQAGEIDFVAKMSPSNAMPFTKMPGYAVNWLDADGNNLILFNCTSGPFANKLVRQAVAYAIDRDAINTIVFEGVAKPWDYFYSPRQAGAPDYDSLPHFTYDVDKAKSLLAEAGYPDGFKLSKKVPIMASMERYVVAVQQQLAKVGITFDIETLEQNTLYSKIFALDYEMLPFSLSTEIYDLSYQSKRYYSPAVQPPAFPFGEFGNAEIDALITAGSTTADLAARIQAYTELHKIIFEEQPLVSVTLNQTAIVRKDKLQYKTPDVLKVRAENLYWVE